MHYFSDCHSCLPLHGDTDLNQLKLHFDAGVRYVSVNVGMDMNPLEQVITTIAGYRQQIARSDWLIQAETYADIERALMENKLAVSFDLEGALPLLDDINMIALYRQLGVRQIHLAYNRNNAIAGGAHDVPQGLTKLGERIVAEIHKKHILMDLSHNSEETARDICKISAGFPVLYSHANPKGIVNHGRNISDEMIASVAGTGGLIAVNGVGTFMGDTELSPNTLVKIIDYVVAIAGVTHTAIGLDYGYDDGVPDVPADVDRGFWWPVSAGYIPGKGVSGNYLSPSALCDVADGLARLNYSENDISLIMKDNILNLIRRVW